MLSVLGQLNDRFFKLYGDVYENTELLTKKQSDFMTERLFEQYKTEYSKLFIEKEILDKQDIFSLKKRRNGYVPFKFLFFKNRAYKLLKGQVVKELDEFFYKKFLLLNKEVDNKKIYVKNSVKLNKEIYVKKKEK